MKLVWCQPLLAHKHVAPMGTAFFIIKTAINKYVIKIFVLFLFRGSLFRVKTETRENHWPDPTLHVGKWLVPSEGRDSFAAQTLPCRNTYCLYG